MINIGKTFIEAVNHSGLFGYLKNIGSDKISFTLAQDDNQVYADIVLEQKTPERVKTSASMLNTVFFALKMLEERGIKKLDENSKILVENTKITTTGNNLALNFALSKDIAQELVNRKLKSLAENRTAK
jgi:hypothetical protein